jgi:hypothetical protein
MSGMLELISSWHIGKREWAGVSWLWRSPPVSLEIVMDNVLLFAYPGPVSVYKPPITGNRLTEKADAQR